MRRLCHGQVLEHALCGGPPHGAPNAQWMGKHVLQGGGQRRSQGQERWPCQVCVEEEDSPRAWTKPPGRIGETPYGGNVRPPKQPTGWGIQMGRKREPDKVSALLTMEDDEETAATEEMTDEEDEALDDGEGAREDDWLAGEAAPASPPAEPLYNGRGEFTRRDGVVATATTGTETAKMEKEREGMTESRKRNGCSTADRAPSGSSTAAGCAPEKSGCSTADTAPSGSSTAAGRAPRRSGCSTADRAPSGSSTAAGRAPKRDGCSTADAAPSGSSTATGRAPGRSGCSTADPAPVDSSTAAAITGHSGEEPISMKKLLEGEGLWEVRKEILGWMMDGATRCIELAEKKRKAILAELRTVLRMQRGVPLKQMQKLVGKLRHAAIGIPAGKYLFGPINRLMAREPRKIFWDRATEARRALQDMGQLIREVAAEPTHVNELVPGPPTYKGTPDASGKGAGGVWVPGEKSLVPIVWRLCWPDEVVRRLVTFDNPDGDITNSDLEMAAKVLGWLVLEANAPTRHAHVTEESHPYIGNAGEGVGDLSKMLSWNAIINAIGGEAVGKFPHPALLSSVTLNLMSGHQYRQGLGIWDPLRDPRLPSSTGTELHSSL
ncbi:hypothetical protein ACHAWF_018791 [Thalassiosira exigua]